LRRELQHALGEQRSDALGAYCPRRDRRSRRCADSPITEDYADWLEQRLDEITVARPHGTAGAKREPPPPKPGSPLLHLWLARVRTRPAPARAAALMPRLRAAFVAEACRGNAWLAEAESS